MSNTELLHAYRHLLRAGLRAVQFSYPARNVVQSQLRKAFRAKPRGSEEGSERGGGGPVFDAEAVRRTVWFLKAAAAERGLEHRIVKNLVRVAWFRQGREESGLVWKMAVQMAKQESSGEMKKKRKSDPIKTTNYEHYEATIAMLNHSMGLCLPLR